MWYQWNTSKKAKWFAAQTSSNDLKKVCEGFVPKTTQRCTTRAVSISETWKTTETNSAMINVLTIFLRTLLSHCWTSGCLPSSLKLNARMEKGVLLQQSQTSSLVTEGLLITNPLTVPILWIGKITVSIISMEHWWDHRFNALNGALKSVFHKLRENDVSAVVKHASIVTPQEEELLWSMGTIGTSLTLSLQQVIFYYVGKVFCKRRKRATQKGTCDMRVARLPNHEAAYTSYTAHYWYEPFTNILLSSKLMR